MNYFCTYKSSIFSFAVSLYFLFDSQNTNYSHMGWVVRFHVTFVPIMRLFYFASLIALCNALLEAPIVTFNRTSALQVSLHDAAIAYDFDDPEGVKIAARSLSHDFLAITGTRPAVWEVHDGDWQALPSNGSRNIIFAGTVHSKVVQDLSERGLVDVSDVLGKWEVFKTTTISNASITGVGSMLAIISNDKRGAIFGIHTLAEQCGQSP